MKKLALAMTLLMGAVLCSAQSAYVKSTTTNGVITLTNVSGQPIVLLVGQLQLNGKTTVEKDADPNNYTHEYFFKAPGWPAGESADIDTKETPTSKAFNYTLTITFLQFEDGSTWGDKNTAAGALIKRAASLAFLQKLVAASNSHPAFLSVLNDTYMPGSQEEAAARRFQSIQNQAGTSAAIANAKDRLAAATTRLNSGKF